MRAGGCAVQQALTTDAAAIVKQAVVLAKRRGHAQVTPLHVANTMLSAPSGLFRVACMKSHSHPLQCKALELCFNVALNRLPASSSGPILGQAHSQYPSISNALVAAFKRAQAHQRRGSIENQQQPILAVKIELEQLIISILDDPSVSRVMKEAGFSSTQVKRNVEKAVSLELCSQSSPKPEENRKIVEPSEAEPIRNEDVNVIIKNLSTNMKRKSLVIVGENISNIESTVKELMNRVDKGDVPEGLREVKFISIPPLYSFCNLRREEVEQKMGELTCLVKSLVVKGVVLYLGDLRWISDYRASSDRESGHYCSVEHMIMEIGRLVWGINGEIGRFWLMGIATFQSYMKCRNGYVNSLETVWGLHPVTVPANSLGLSLISDQSDEPIEAGQRETIANGNGEGMNLTCCDDCSAKFKAEAAQSCTNEPTSSSLPAWLKDARTRLSSANDQTCDSSSVKELCKKWNLYCSSAHKKLDRSTLESSSASPSSSTRCFLFDRQNPSLQQSHSFPLLNMYSVSNSNPSSTHNSTSSSEIMEMEYAQKFNEFNAENLNILCNALERKVPWQRDVIPEISGTILQCRSRMLRRKEQLNYDVKEETWLMFLGLDSQAKEKVSTELAKVVFGSYSNFVTIRSSDIEGFAQAVSDNPHRVFFVKDLDGAHYSSSLMRIKEAIESGRISINDANGEEAVQFCDAIIVLSCERLSSKSQSTIEEDEGTSCVSLDLNISFDCNNVEDDQSMHELGILESTVDRSVVFRVQEL